MFIVRIPVVIGDTVQLIPAITHAQYEREQTRRNSSHPKLWRLLDEVKDPEIPVLSLWDMGVLQDIQYEGDAVRVTITPTYSGCPAMDVMREDIIAHLQNNGVKDCSVKTVLSPAWTTDWMTDKGRAQLRDYGIAPPNDVVDHEGCETPESKVLCPHCGSSHTQRISEFGSTACKALFKCQDCSETFDYFKNI